MQTTANNTRSSDRVSPSLTEATVRGLGNEPILAAVIDESFGGIGLDVPITLQPGESISNELIVEHGGVEGVALVRHVSVMPSGTRLGLEWKAQALSRCLRDLLYADNKLHRELSRILPGGLSMMWKLLEAKRWPLLLSGADRLRREVAVADIEELEAPIVKFKSIVKMTIEGKATHEEVKTALNSLIRQCINIIG